MSRRDEKAAATRQQLMNATFECLVELGYPGTSTVAVCERAGLARGTMLHHFPTKDALVLGVLEDVLMRRAEEFRTELERVNTHDLATSVRHLWAAVKGPTYMAWLELAVASRTNPVLAKEFRKVMGRFDEAVTTVIAATLPPDFAGELDLKTAVSVVFSTLNGFVLDLLQADPEQVETKVDVLIEWLIASQR